MNKIAGVLFVVLILQLAFWFYRVVSKTPAELCAEALESLEEARVLKAERPDSQGASVTLRNAQQATNVRCSAEALTRG